MILKVFGGHLGGNFGGNWRKKGSHRLFKIALNSLFNDRGVHSYKNFAGVIFGVLPTLWDHFGGVWLSYWKKFEGNCEEKSQKG